MGFVPSDAWDRPGRLWPRVGRHRPCAGPRGWIAEARAFVMEETGIPAPEACVRRASKARLDGLVFPAVLDESHGETVAAVYVPATGEFLLADDLDPGTPLARSYLVHELVHAQQFTSRA